MKNGVDYNHEQDDEYKYCHVKRYQQNERDFLVWPNGRSTLDQPPPSFFSLVIFNFALFFILVLPGDQHWGELLAKKMPQSEEFGAEQVRRGDDL